MAISSKRSVTHQWTGDLSFTQTTASAINATAPGQIEKKNLSSGANTITVPSGAVAVTIQPPSGNAQALTLKGVSGDTGITIHKTDPTSLGLDNVSTFVINAASTVNAVIFIWS